MGTTTNGLADEWTVQPNQGKHQLDPKTARKFRIRDLLSSVGAGVSPRGYEIEIPAQAGIDAHSTGDIWATVLSLPLVVSSAPVAILSSS